MLGFVLSAALGVQTYHPPNKLSRLEPPKNGKWERFVATAYSHGCTMPRSGMEFEDPQATASGREAEANWSVAASEEFPFLTVLQISYDGIVTTRIVHDRGLAITKGRLDFFVKDCKSAKRFGKKVIWVREVRRPLGR